MTDKFDVSHMLSKGWRAEAAKEWSGHEGTREAAAGALAHAVCAGRERKPVPEPRRSGPPGMLHKSSCTQHHSATCADS